MHEAAARKLRKARDQSFMQRVELIRLRRKFAAGDELLQPVPLNDGGFEQARRRVGVVFEELRTPPAVIGEIEATVERGVPPPPALGDQIARMGRDAQAIHRRFAGDDAVDEFEAQGVDLLRRRLDVSLDLPQGEDIADALVPVGGAIDMRIGEADLLEMRGRVGADGGGFTPHQPPPEKAWPDLPKPPKSAPAADGEAADSRDDHRQERPKDRR